MPVKPSFKPKQSISSTLIFGQLPQVFIGLLTKSCPQNRKTGRGITNKTDRSSEWSVASYKGDMQSWKRKILSELRKRVYRCTKQLVVRVGTLVRPKTQNPPIYFSFSPSPNKLLRNKAELKEKSPHPDKLPPLRRAARPYAPFFFNSEKGFFVG